MSIWIRIGDFVANVSKKASASVVELVEAVRTLFAGDPELRRQVAFSVAMIALSAKMAKADGVVTQDEAPASKQIFPPPPSDAPPAARLYDIAKQDVAGFEAYAQQMSRLCGSGHPNCAMLEDVLDGLFFIAKADGALHEREDQFLHRVAEIFEISEQHYQTILARHVDLGQADPYIVLGIPRGSPPDAVKKHYRQLVATNHPDRLIARGLPQELIAIATARLAAINVAYELIEKGLKAA